jgi:hypothetical protein
MQDLSEGRTHPAVGSPDLAQPPEITTKQTRSYLQRRGKARGAVKKMMEDGVMEVTYMAHLILMEDGMMEDGSTAAPAPKKRQSLTSFYFQF